MFTVESAGERILKIGLHILAKLWARVECPIFDSRGIHFAENLIIYLLTLMTYSATCSAMHSVVPSNLQFSLKTLPRA